MRDDGVPGHLLGLGEKRRDLPTEFHGTPSSAVRDIKVFSPGCLVVETTPFGEGDELERDGAPSRADELKAAIANDPAFADWPLLVLTDDAKRAAKSSINFLWTTFTRFDPASDLTASKVELRKNHAAFTPPVVLDARMKPWYPEELFCDEDTARLVEARWSDYFPSGMVEMGDSDRGHLD